MDTHKEYIALLDLPPATARRLDQGYAQLVALMRSDAEELFIEETPDSAGTREFYTAHFFWPDGTLGEVELRPSPHVATVLYRLRPASRLAIHRTACASGGPYSAESRVRVIVFHAGEIDPAGEYKASGENCRKLDEVVLPRLVQQSDIRST